MPTALFISILALSAVVSSFVSGILGMAGGMILMGVLLAMMPVPAAMMLHGITQFAANAWRAFLWRKSVDWRVFRQYLYGALTAVGAFAILQFVASKPVAFIVLGLTPFVSLALPEKLHLNVERRGHAFMCGIICSALSLTAGVSGPILDVFFVRSKMGRKAVVATKATTQGASHLLKVLYFGGVAAAGGAVAPWLGVMMVALAILGTTLSRHVLERMNDASFRLWTRWTVMSLGAFYLASGVFMLMK